AALCGADRVVLDRGRAPGLRAHRAAGGEVCTILEGQVCSCRGARVEPLLPVVEIPLTIGGRARHNVANVLGVVALARALGLASEAIVTGLREFGRDPTDNPGRARAWSVPGAGGCFDVLLDFGHNLAGLAAMAELAKSFGRPVIVSIGMAGDRSDDDLRSIGRALLEFEPKHVILREQADYLRGRELGVVPGVIGEGVAQTGYSAGQVTFVADEVAALVRARELASAGDLVVHLVHTDREAVEAWLAEVGARPSQLAG
ncbi:MAG: hypothetical protein HC927_04050, partial [Deltaproteobacteria bacterium]|nr:hypothetical protein [Deltaproteobacteria bacterium]